MTTIASMTSLLQRPSPISDLGKNRREPNVAKEPTHARAKGSSRTTESKQPASSSHTLKTDKKHVFTEGQHEFRHCLQQTEPSKPKQNQDNPLPADKPSSTAKKPEIVIDSKQLAEDKTEQNRFYPADVSLRSKKILETQDIESLHLAKANQSEEEKLPTWPHVSSTALMPFMHHADLVSVKAITGQTTDAKPLPTESVPVEDIAAASQSLPPLSSKNVTQSSQAAVDVSVQPLVDQALNHIEKAVSHPQLSDSVDRGTKLADGQTELSPDKVVTSLSNVWTQQLNARQMMTSKMGDAQSVSQTALNFTQLSQALNQKIESYRLYNVDNSVIRLDPPHLGSIQIHLKHEAGHLMVQIVSERQEVATRLNDNINLLKHDLLKQHYQDVAVKVQWTGASGTHTASQGGSSEQQSHSQKPEESEQHIGQSLRQVTNAETSFLQEMR